jgi:hypothetical protein
MLSRLGEFWPTLSESTGYVIDLNRTLSAGDTVLACAKKPNHISPADMPKAVILFDKMPRQAPLPTDVVRSFPLVNCQC